MKYTCCLLLLLTAVACNNNSENRGEDGPEDGGPCRYETVHLPATLLAVIKKDSTGADLLFRVQDKTGRLYRDSVSWYMQEQELVPLSRLEKDSIVVGKQYRYQVQKLVSGSCKGRLEQLLLQEYREE
jgi:hypothetical protein